MKKVVIGEDEFTILLSAVHKERTPIFAQQEGVLKGMVVHELSKGWILRIGGTFGVTGHHPTLKGCIESCLPHGYEFFVN